MSFIVEDGSGKKGATSYATIAFFKAYFADRGVNVTALADATIQELLVTATDYIDTRWGPSFLGTRLWTSLLSRSVFTLTDQPTDGEKVTINSVDYVFRDDPTLDTEAEIGDTIYETLENLVDAFDAGDTDDVISDCMLADPDITALTIFVSRDGITTTTDCADGSFDVAASVGYSAHEQPLEFPRGDLYDRAGCHIDWIPDRLKEATCEYAYRANSAALAPDPSVDNTVISMSTSVGPVSKSVTYAGGTVLRALKAYPAADRLLQEYVKPGGVIRN